MAIDARYTHTNLIAKDWQKLCDFYTNVFGCVPLPPERNLRGEWLEDVTGVEQAHIQGIHLRLPGCGQRGPTLEIFQYNHHTHSEPSVNRPGFAHIAFAVADVPAACKQVLAAGGKAIGDIVASEIPGAGHITFAYVSDPEGNVIELQHWQNRD